jgi:hypothetical protein
MSGDHGGSGGIKELAHQQPQVGFLPIEPSLI